MAIRGRATPMSEPSSPTTSRTKRSTTCSCWRATCTWSRSDDGTNANYSSEPGAGFPLMHVAALTVPAAPKAGHTPWVRSWGRGTLRCRRRRRGRRRARRRPRGDELARRTPPAPPLHGPAIAGRNAAPAHRPVWSGSHRREPATREPETGLHEGDSSVVSSDIAVAVGYLLGTESGRERGELILVKLGRTSDGGLAVESITDIIEDAPRV